MGKRLGKHIGGMAANQAIEAARYFKGVELIGKVGGDQEGQSMIRQLEERNVGTQLVIVDKSLATGQSYMYLVGDDYFSVVTQEANQSIFPDEAERAVNGLGNGILMVSLEIPIEAAQSALAQARHLGIETILVPSPPEICTPALLAAADMLILNRREAQKLLAIEAVNLVGISRELCNLRTRYRCIVVTMGSEGAVLWDGNEASIASALPVNPIDTTGAGDAFAGAFVAAYALGMPLQKALALGCIAGGLTVSVLGAQTSDHTMDKVLKMYDLYYSKGK